MSAPLLPLALAFALGVGLGLAVDTPVWLGPVGLLAASAALLVGRGRSLAGASAGVLVLCALAGWARVTLPDPFPSVAGLRPVRSPLTPREWEVLDLLCAGLSMEEVTEALVLSPETVRSHLQRAEGRVRLGRGQQHMRRS